MISPLLLAQMKKLVHDAGTLMAFDAFCLAERQAMESFGRPQVGNCECGRGVYAKTPEE